MIVNLKRSNRHIVKISLDGYHPYELNINKKVNGWIIGNIVLGGIIGLAVDAISGGMYKLSPDEINAELKANETNVTAFESKKDGISVFVTLKPNPNWVKIGQLEAMK